MLFTNFKQNTSVQHFPKKKEKKEIITIFSDIILSRVRRSNPLRVKQTVIGKRERTLHHKQKFNRWISETLQHNKFSKQ